MPVYTVAFSVSQMIQNHRLPPSAADTDWLRWEVVNNNENCTAMLRCEQAEARHTRTTGVSIRHDVNPIGHSTNEKITVRSRGQGEDAASVPLAYQEVLKTGHRFRLSWIWDPDEPFSSS